MTGQQKNYLLKRLSQIEEQKAEAIKQELRNIEDGSGRLTWAALLRKHVTAPITVRATVGDLIRCSSAASRVAAVPQYGLTGKRTYTYSSTVTSESLCVSVKWPAAAVAEAAAHAARLTQLFNDKEPRLRKMHEAATALRDKLMFGNEPIPDMLEKFAKTQF